MGNNNLSRRLFTQFLVLNNLVRDGVKNVFYLPSGEKCAFSLTPSHKKYAEVRQAYQDVKYILSYWQRNNKLYIYGPNEWSFVNNAPNRYDSSGNVKATTARAGVVFSDKTLAVNYVIPSGDK